VGWLRWGFIGAIVCAGCGNGGVRSGDAAVIPSQADGGFETAAVLVPDAHSAHADAAVADAMGDGVPSGATWTSIYQTLLVNTSYASNCTGSSCHDPGTQKGVDFSTQQNGYTTISHRMVPGSPDSSTVVIVLESGAMPQGRPHMPASDIALIRAWIAAGAPNN